MALTRAVIVPTRDDREGDQFNAFFSNTRVAAPRKRSCEMMERVFFFRDSVAEKSSCDEIVISSTARALYQERSFLFMNIRCHNFYTE